MLKRELRRNPIVKVGIELQFGKQVINCSCWLIRALTFDGTTGVRLFALFGTCDCRQNRGQYWGQRGIQHLGGKVLIV